MTQEEQIYELKKKLAEKENKSIKLKIHSFEYNLLLVNEKDERLIMDDGEYHSGVTDFKKKEIYVNKNLCNNSLAYTIKHELTHAIIDSYGLLQIEWTDEIVADFMAIYLDTIIELLMKIDKEVN